MDIRFEICGVKKKIFFFFCSKNIAWISGDYLFEKIFSCDVFEILSEVNEVLFSWETRSCHVALGSFCASFGIIFLIVVYERFI